MKPKDWLKLAVCIVVCEGAGLIGALYSMPAMPRWYAYLQKPAATPPDWVFGPVWSVLYILMAVAVFLVWRTYRPSAEAKKGKRRMEFLMILIIFTTQLELNIFWPIIFFGLRDPQSAFLEILLLIVDVAAIIAVFSKFSRRAAWLLVPYLLWIIFAAYLNYGIWQLNPNPVAVVNRSGEGITPLGPSPFR